MTSNSNGKNATKETLSSERDEPPVSPKMEILKLQQEEESLRQKSIESANGTLSSIEQLVGVDMNENEKQKGPKAAKTVAEKLQKWKQQNKELRKLLSTAIMETKRRSEEANEYKCAVGELDCEIMKLHTKIRAMEQENAELEVERKKVTQLERQLTIQMVGKKQIQDKLQKLLESQSRNSKDIQHHAVSSREVNNVETKINNKRETETVHSLKEQNSRLKVAMKKLIQKFETTESSWVSQKEDLEGKVENLSLKLQSTETENERNMIDIAEQTKFLLIESTRQKATIGALKRQFENPELFRQSKETMSNSTSDVLHSPLMTPAINTQQPPTESPMPVVVNTSTESSDIETHKLTIDLKKSKIRLDRALRDKESLEKQLSQINEENEEKMNSFATELETVLLECQNQQRLIGTLRKRFNDSK